MWIYLYTYTRRFIIDWEDESTCVVGHRFNPKTGAIEDACAGVDAFFYMPRTLPVQCFICCNGSFETHPGFLNHLKSSGHIRKFIRKWDEIPEEWHDPRICDDFDTMTNFEQVTALFEFKAKVLRKLREPMSDLAVDRMDQELEELCISEGIQCILDSTDVRASALKRLIRVAKDVAEDNFTHYGVNGYCCLYFLTEKWGIFFLHAKTSTIGFTGIVEAIKG
jgi:hypothetical protein